MFEALKGNGHKDNDLCFVPVTHKKTLGEIVDLLYKFNDEPNTLMMPNLVNGSFEKKLYSTFLSYLPERKVKFELKGNFDDRGSFTEFIKTESNGQFSINISKPGITKGQHWHNTKWEFFLVVSGKALIQERKIGTEEIIEFEVSGEKLEAVHMLPGYTHNIINLSDTDNLVTIMWANEVFDKNKPDTFFEEV
jgi:UDP-2-acetamido-2,6-beta-L-arabino-hexul-4-ose reductase